MQLLKVLIKKTSAVNSSLLTRPGLIRGPPVLLTNPLTTVLSCSVRESFDS